MAHLIERHNPLQPHARDVVRVPAGLTVRQALEHAHPGFVEFVQPTLVSLNGRPLMRSTWDDTVVEEGDTLAAAVLPAGIETIFYIFMAVVAVATYVMVSNMPTPKNPADLPAPDPVFSLSGQRNTMKIMEPIEVAYGRNKLWPSYAARPFNKYEGNEQYLYQLFCLGQGEFQVHGIYIEDTPIDSFQNVTYQLVPPGGQVTLFPGNVVTSVEVNRLELFGPNEAQYTVYGPFALTASFTVTNKIEVDLTLPQGLYSSNDDDGGLSAVTVTALFEVRLIDDNGAPAGAWQTLAEFTKTLNTVNPQRYTLSVDVASGRYEIRGKRTNNASGSYRVGDTLTWESARAFLPNTTDYGSVTMLAVVAQASNNLNDNSANRINVDCTRKLVTRQNGAWTAAVPTRSVAWAFYDIFASAYGGQLGSEYIDLDELERLDAVWEGRQEYFDFVFNQKTTVWEAAKAAARVGRAVPIVNGSFVGLVRDETQAIPMGVFGVDNMLPDSFKWEVKLFDPKEYDSVQMVYVNSTSGLQESVMCLPPGSLGLNPNKITLAGCTNRDHAYHEGMYIAMSDRLLRENVTFRTGLEGYLPSYGDFVAVSYPLPKWGTSGHVVGRSGNTLMLSEQVTFTAGQQHYILLRRDDGAGDGPYLVTQGPDSMSVELATSMSSGLTFGDTSREPVLFAFGPGQDWSRKCRVVEINPAGDEAVEVTCVNYDPAIFQFDQTSAPPVSAVPRPPSIPDRPVVPFLTVARVPTALDYVIVSWGPALGASSYVLQQSTDGVNWTTVTQTSALSYQLNVVRGSLYLRVAGRGVALGTWATWNGEVGSPTGAPLTVQNLTLQQPFVGPFAKVQWSSLVDADTYKVKVYKDAGATLLRTSTVSGVEFNYTSEMMALDGTPARALRFMVYGTNEFGDSAVAAVLDVTNPVPTQMGSGFSYQVKVETGDTVVYTLNWLPNGDGDVKAYRVWGSPSSGFAPDSTDKKFEGLAYQCDVSVSKVAHVVNITGATKAGPCVLSYSGTPLGNGQKVVVAGVGGMVQLNGNTYVVRGATSATFQLYSEAYDSETGSTYEVPVDSTYYSTYTSGGTATVTPQELVRPKLYWRVAAVDLWGDDTNPSSQQTAQ